MKVMYNEYMLIERTYLMKLLCKLDEIIVEMLGLFLSCPYAQWGAAPFIFSRDDHISAYLTLWHSLKVDLECFVNDGDAVWWDSGGAMALTRTSVAFTVHFAPSSLFSSHSCLLPGCSAEGEWVSAPEARTSLPPCLIFLHLYSVPNCFQIPVC